MGVLSSFFSLFGAERERVVASANFPLWISAHKAWKQRLELTVAGRHPERVDVEKARRDDQCDMGKWILHDGEEHFADHPTFLKLKSEHAHFHRCAAGVAEMAHRGDAASAGELLHGEFSDRSDKVIGLLEKLERETR